MGMHAISKAAASTALISFNEIFFVFIFFPPSDCFQKRTDALNRFGNAFKNLSDSAFFSVKNFKKSLGNSFAEYSAAHTDEITEGSFDRNCPCHACGNAVRIELKYVVELFAVLCVACVFKVIAEIDGQILTLDFRRKLSAEKRNILVIGNALNIARIISGSCL